MTEILLINFKTTSLWRDENHLLSFEIWCRFWLSQQGMLGALIVWWPASFWLQWTMAEGTVHTGSPAKFPPKPIEEWKKNRKMYALRSVQNTGTCYPGLGWICQVHLGFGLSSIQCISTSDACLVGCNSFFQITKPFLTRKLQARIFKFWSKSGYLGCFGVYCIGLRNHPLRVSTVRWRFQ